MSVQEVKMQQVWTAHCYGKENPWQGKEWGTAPDSEEYEGICAIQHAKVETGHIAVGPQWNDWPVAYTSKEFK